MDEPHEDPPVKTQLQRSLQLAWSSMDESRPGWLQRLWILAHGGNATALLSALLGLQCLLHSLAVQGDARSTISAMNATIVLCGACYQRFWARDRHLLRHLLGDLLQLAERLEGRAEGEALEFAHRTGRLVSVCRWVVALDVPVALVFMVTWPLATGRLTFHLDWSLHLHAPQGRWDGALGGALGGALFFAQYAGQSVAISCSFFCFAGLQVVHVTLALVSAALFRTLAQLVEAARCPRQLHAVLADHRALLQVVARFSHVFEEPLFQIHAGALGFALLATRSLVAGHVDMYVVGLWPIAFAYTTVLGLEGDQVQESSELMLHAALAGRWLSGPRAGTGPPVAPLVGPLGRDLLFVMVRASRPSTIRATWLGPLSLPTLHRLLSSWYSFTNLFIKLR